MLGVVRVVTIVSGNVYRVILNGREGREEMRSRVCENWP